MSPAVLGRRASEVLLPPFERAYLLRALPVGLVMAELSLECKVRSEEAAETWPLSGDIGSGNLFNRLAMAAQ